MKSLSFFTFFLIVSLSSFSQTLLSLDFGCNYSGGDFKKELYSFESANEAESALKKVMKFTGLPTNFIILAGDVPNAQASIHGSMRYIIYSQLFMKKVKRETNTDWAAISILAHEIGHHLSGHTLDGIGSRPNKELEADRFSGFILAKMGASLDESLIAMSTIASEEASSTHPGRSTRLAAITNGWQAAKDAEKDPEKKNVPTIEKKIERPVIRGNISNVWVEHNLLENNRKGMKIHVSFTVDNMQGVKGNAVAYFYFNDGSKLKDYNGVFTSSDGQVSVGNEFTPLYSNTVFNNFSLFLPYDELHMNSGKYDLKFLIELFEYREPNEPKNIGQSNYISFQYSSY